jgi:hypothetical protein
MGRYAVLSCIKRLRKTFRRGNQVSKLRIGRSQWPRGLRRRSTAVRLLRLWVRIPPGSWMFVCCECCVLSGRGLCDELITRPEESYRLCCVVVCDLETTNILVNEEAKAHYGAVAPREKKSLEPKPDVQNARWMCQSLR